MKERDGGDRAKEREGVGLLKREVQGRRLCLELTFPYLDRSCPPLWC